MSRRNHRYRASLRTLTAELQAPNVVPHGTSGTHDRVGHPRRADPCGPIFRLRARGKKNPPTGGFCSRSMPAKPAQAAAPQRPCNPSDRCANSCSARMPLASASWIHCCSRFSAWSAPRCSISAARRARNSHHGFQRRTLWPARLHAVAAFAVQPAAAVGQGPAHPARHRLDAFAGALRLVAQGRHDHAAVVIGHGLEAMGEHRLQGVGIGQVHVRTHVQRRRDAQHLGQTRPHAGAQIAAQPMSNSHLRRANFAELGNA